MTKEAILILHNIRSAHNIGSIFRTADALGAKKIYLTGISPRPVDQFNRPRKEIAKTALGAEKTIPWEYRKSAGALIKSLKKAGVEIIAIEQAPNSLDYKKVKPKFPVAFILGNEVDGIDKKVRGLCDVIAEIPMRGELARNRLPDDGGKESLNVAVSAGVALFRMLNI